MVKKRSAHINLASPGEHEFLASVSFEHARSVALRIQEIRLRPARNEKPYKVPLNLLTWFTQHAAAGREITRDDNNQANEASLYTNQALLREQIETFSLKETFYLEVEITELDENDESCIREDQGVMNLEVKLYYGPKAKCLLGLEPVQPSKEQHLLYPIACGAQGRIDIASAMVKSNLGPLDPRSDKRLLLSTIKLSDTWQPLRNSLIERLRIYEGSTELPGEFIEDEHAYEEIYKAFPHAQNKNFPKGAKAFGPLLPSAPKEKRGPWTLSIAAPINDPLWLEMASIRAANNNQPLHALLELIIPEPGGNISVECQFSIQFDENDWLILQDGAGMSAPLCLPVNRDTTEQSDDNIFGELLVTGPEIECPASQFLSLQYYGLGLSDGPVNVAITPSSKDAEFYNVKPEVTELSSQQHQLILLNQIALNKKQKAQKGEFKLKCFSPDKQKTENFKISIKQVEKTYSQFISIDIGSKSLAMAAFQSKETQNTEEKKEFQNCALGEMSPDHYLDKAFIPSKLSLSGRLDTEPKETELDDDYWPLKTNPLKVSFSKSSWKTSSLDERLTAMQRTYDIALPPKGKKQAGEKKNLKRIFSQTNNIEEPASHGLYSKDLKEIKKAPPTYLTAARVKTNEIAQKGETAPLETEHFKTGLTASLNSEWLMSDVLDELYNYFGSKLSLSPSLVEGEKKQKSSQVNRGSVLALTHSSNLSQAAKRRYQLAGANTLTKFEQGSFLEMGPMAELLGLKGPDQAKDNVLLVDEILASSYHALKTMAIQDQPARAKKVQQIHIDIGASHAAYCAQTGWVGETNALLEQVHGLIELAFGGRALELALSKEIAQTIETALSAGAQIIKQSEFPASTEEIKDAESQETETAYRQNQFLNDLRRALYAAETAKDQAGNDLHIVLGRSEREGHYLLTLSSSIVSADEPISLWHGLRGEQLVCISSNEGKTWHIELRVNSELLAQKVGPLSTYLAFVAELLPRSIEQVFPKTNEKCERVLSASGGTCLFGPLKKLLESTAKTLEFRLLPLPKNYKAAKSATSLGALELCHYQNTVPRIKQTSNLILVPLSDSLEGETDMISVAEKGKLIVVEQANSNGLLPRQSSSVQLIETLPGFGSLLNEDPRAVYCQTYLDDLDRASTEQWAIAGAEWQSYLDLCYQTLINLPVEDHPGQPVDESSDSEPEQQKWSLKTLKAEETELSIGQKTFRVSTGLKRSTF